MAALVAVAAAVAGGRKGTSIPPDRARGSSTASASSRLRRQVGRSGNDLDRRSESIPDRPDVISGSRGWSSPASRGSSTCACSPTRACPTSRRGATPCRSTTAWSRHSRGALPRRRYRPGLLRRPSLNGKAGTGASQRQSTETAVIVVDLDEGDIAAKRMHLIEHLGLPTLVVASGGVTAAGEPKLHLYWRLAEPGQGRRPRSSPQGPGDRRPQGRRRRLGRQGPAADPPRRLGALQAWLPRPVRIVEDDGSGLRNRRARARGRGDAVDRRGRGGRGGRGSAPTPRAGPIRAGGVDGITRFDALSRFIGEQVRQVRLGRHDAGARRGRPSSRSMPTWIDPSWEETRLRREFEALELVDRRNHGGRRELIDDLDRTEHGLARRLADEHAAEWRYVPGIGWLSWTGSRWRPDETGRILEVCRRLCEDAAAGQPAPDRRRLLTDRTIRAVERLARSDPRLAAGAAEWDRDGMLLNTPAGVIDLRTGEVLAERSPAADDPDHPGRARRHAARAGSHSSRASPAATARWPPTCSASPATA